MKVEFNNEIKKQFLEVLPSIAIGWYGGINLYFGWLFWNVIIIF